MCILHHTTLKVRVFIIKYSWFRISADIMIEICLEIVLCHIELKNKYLWEVYMDMYYVMT